MSAFNPRALFGASDQKRALLERLMQQYQQSASRASGLSSGAAGTGGVGMPAALTHPFGGLGHLTGPGPNLRADLMDRLGAGGYGHGITGVESSDGYGSPVSAYGGGAAPPGHGLGAPPIAPGPPHPIQAQGPPSAVQPGPLGAAATSTDPNQAITAIGSGGFNPASLLPGPMGPNVDPRTGAMRGSPGPRFFGGFPRRIF